MISILYEDQDLIAIHKPPGIPSQSTFDPKRPHIHGMLKSQLGQEVFLHHRLDKDTSGVMIFGKSKRVNHGLTEIFRQHQIQKTYLCISKVNRPPDEMKFIVHNFLAPVRNQKKQLMRMTSVKKGGWEAITDFEIKKISMPFAFIEARPKTGRTHQIRIHLAEKKLPILGDPLYGGKSSLTPRLLLHAFAIEFRHPITEKLLRIESPLPSDFEKILSNLKLDC